ncbi:MAG: hypothetical protein ACLGXA_09910 [Acidobacteriota bacterium]
MPRLPLYTPFLLLAATLACAPALAQSGGSAKPAASSSGGSSSSPSGPFSIETEMFTYKAVEHNSAVIACDTAQYLYHGEVTAAAAGAHTPCTIAGAAPSASGIIVISSGSTLLADFQSWRADMAGMRSLLAHADAACIVNPAKTAPSADHPHPHIEGRSLLGTALGGFSSPTEAASVAGDVIKMFSHDQSVTSVVGTVQDPALVNEVARQLRALNVQVLVPELYSPWALGSIDYAHSPYLQNMQSLFDAYDKCSDARASYSSDAPQANDADAVLAGIKSFLTSAFAAPPKAAPSSAAATDPGAQTQGTPITPPSHFASVLSADALAQKIGFSATGATDPGSPWHNLLWVKALESGGSVTKQSSILGTKVFFGGGAVDTYSVFSLTGDLVCSGNVYSFQQPVNVKGVQKAVATPSPDPPAQWESEHSTCAPLTGN